MLTKFIQVAVRRQFCRAMSMTRPVVDPVQLSLLDEACILVDENDRAVGEASKKDCHQVQPGGNLLLHRAFSLFVFNSKNELVVQKRSPYKITYPDVYSNTCCSHPLASIADEAEESEGLGARRAAQRRLAIELGVPPEQAPPESIHFIDRIHYIDFGDGKWGEHEITYILFMKANVTFDLNRNEVSEIVYLSLKDLDKFLAENKGRLTPWFHRLGHSKLKYWWENLDQLEKIKNKKTITRL